MYKSLEDIIQLNGQELDNSTASIIELSGEELIEAATYFFRQTTSNKVTKDHLRILFKIISEQILLGKNTALKLDINVIEALYKRLQDLKNIDPAEDFSTTIRLENGKKINVQQAFLDIAKAAAYQNNILNIINNDNYSIYTSYFDKLIEMKLASTDFVDLFKYSRNLKFFNEFVSKVLATDTLNDKDSAILTHLLILKNIINENSAFFPNLSIENFNNLHQLMRSKCANSYELDQIIHFIIKTTISAAGPIINAQLKNVKELINDQSYSNFLNFFAEAINNIKPALTVESSIKKEDDGLILVIPAGGGFDGFNAANLFSLFVERNQFSYEDVVMLPLRSEVTSSQTSKSTVGVKRKLIDHGGEIQNAKVFKINEDTKMSEGRFSDNLTSKYFKTCLAIYPQEDLTLSQQFEASVSHFQDESRRKISKIIIVDTGGDIAFGNKAGASQDWDGLRATQELATKLGIPYEIVIIAPGVDSPNTLNFLEIQTLSDAEFINLSGEQSIKNFNDRHGLDGSKEDFYSKTGYAWSNVVMADPNDCEKVQRVYQMPNALGNHPTNPWELYIYPKKSMAGALWIKDGNKFFKTLIEPSNFNQINSLDKFSDVVYEINQENIVVFKVETDSINFDHLENTKIIDKLLDIKELTKKSIFGAIVKSLYEEGNVDDNTNVLINRFLSSRDSNIAYYLTENSGIDSDIFTLDEHALNYFSIELGRPIVVTIEGISALQVYGSICPGRVIFIRLDKDGNFIPMAVHSEVEEHYMSFPTNFHPEQSFGSNIFYLPNEQNITSYEFDFTPETFNRTDGFAVMITTLSGVIIPEFLLQ